MSAINIIQKNRPDSNTWPDPLTATIIQSGAKSRYSKIPPSSITADIAALFATIKSIYIKIISHFKYDFNGVLAQIDTHRKNGKKICLFIGRQPQEPLPNKEGEIWVSADITGSSSKDGRLHIRLDFNDDIGLNKLAKKFDSVVIDVSTTKHFQNDFAKRFAKILHNENSTLTFEAYRGLRSFHFDIQKAIPVFNPKSYQLIEYVNTNTTTEESISLNIENLQLHLNKIYRTVTLYTEQPFPYENGYFKPNENFAYFVVQDSKEL